MRGATVAFACLLLAAGCSPDGEAGADPSLDGAESPLTGENGISSNGISSNGISSNGLVVEALLGRAITTSSLANNWTLLSALQATDATGDRTRRFFRYMVACALPATSSVSYTWRDAAGVRHTEANSGALGLAPGWASGSLDLTGRQWVSACMAARTNSLGVNVPISLRAKAGPTALQVTTQERSDFSYGEGAFWGDLFADTPFLRSCSRDALRAGPATSQYLTQGRTCASAGCGIITYVGPCYLHDNATSGQACFGRDKLHNDWIDGCTSTMNANYKSSLPVIVTWLKP